LCSIGEPRTANLFIQRLRLRFQQSTGDLVWRFEGFSRRDLLIISSLVESEGTPDVFAKVARVIYNRLDKGMKLQFDSTVHYIFDRRGEIALSLKDTQVQNRYNTFVYEGLPPGPIGSPTRAAIEATLNPADGDWLYFVTVLPNETRFTSSYDEFLRFKAEYKRNYANGAFE
ncbi:MAG: endolytic transglycosylase MltG, partial [Actinobacteria bacterium]|nr:endolytic transglycosylase MltG [Actinomycetota bacterium]